MNGTADGGRRARAFPLFDILLCKNFQKKKTDGGVDFVFLAPIHLRRRLGFAIRRPSQVWSGVRRNGRSTGDDNDSMEADEDGWSRDAL